MLYLLVYLLTDPLLNSITVKYGGEDFNVRSASLCVSQPASYLDS